MTSLDTTPRTLRTGHWTLDASHSSVTFSVVALGVSRVRGRFNRFDVGLEVGATLQDTRLHATIDVSSIDTGVPARDNHLRSPDLLDADGRPTMRFCSTRIVDTGDSWQVIGQLAFGFVTRPVMLDVSFGGVATSFDGSRHAGFRATAALSRTELCVDTAAGIPLDMLADVIDVNLDIQLVEPSSMALDDDCVTGARSRTMAMPLAW